MAVVLTVLALLGLIILAVGAILYLLIRPSQPVYTLLMVIGALVFAVAEVILRLDVLF